MKTITLTDKQFDALFEYLNIKVSTIVNDSIDYQDSQIFEDFEDLIEVHTILEEVAAKWDTYLY